MRSLSKRTRWKAAGASGVLAALGVTAVAFGAASGGATPPQTDRAELQTAGIQNYGSGGNGSGTGPVIRYCFDEQPILNATGNQATSSCRATTSRRRADRPTTSSRRLMSRPRRRRIRTALTRRSTTTSMRACTPTRSTSTPDTWAEGDTIQTGSGASTLDALQGSARLDNTRSGDEGPVNGGVGDVAGPNLVNFTVDPNDPAGRPPTARSRSRSTRT